MSPLRRLKGLKPSFGTQWPTAVKDAIFRRDEYRCVGPRLTPPMPGRCQGPPDPDHVRASGTYNRKSRSTVDNGALLCRFWHHRMKTDAGRTWRPPLLAWIAAHPTDEPTEADHPHVEFVTGCAECDEIRRRPLAARSAGSHVRLAR